MSRQASVIAADEVAYSLTGKISISGVYSTDINLLSDPTFGNQLVFLFIIETSPDDIFKELTVRVDLPGGDMRQREIDIGALTPGQADLVRWRLFFPLLFQNPILRPGPVVATVLHDKGILTPAAPFLILRPRETLPEQPPAEEASAKEAPKH